MPLSPNPVQKKTAPVYDRRNRITLELIILLLVLIDLSLLIPYVFQLWHAPTGEIMYHSPPPGRSKLRAMVLMYILPAAITALITSISALYYHSKVVPLVYAVITAPILAVGWVATLGIWAGCCSRDFDTLPQYCYQRYVEYDIDQLRGVNSSLLYGWMLISAVIIVTYLVYTYMAARDYYRYQQRGRPAMPKDIIELNVANAYHSK